MPQFVPIFLELIYYYLMFIHLTYPHPSLAHHSGVLGVLSLDDAIQPDYLIVPI